MRDRGPYNALQNTQSYVSEVYHIVRSDNHQRARKAAPRGPRCTIDPGAGHVGRPSDR